jgi:hypothetical protein
LPDFTGRYEINWIIQERGREREKEREREREIEIEDLSSGNAHPFETSFTIVAQ